MCKLRKSDPEEISAFVELKHLPSWQKNIAPTQSRIPWLPPLLSFFREPSLVIFMKEKKVYTVKNMGKNPWSARSKRPSRPKAHPNPLKTRGQPLEISSQSLSPLIPEPTKNTKRTHASVLAIAPSSPLLLPCCRPSSSPAAELHPKAPDLRLPVHNLLARAQGQHVWPFSVGPIAQRRRFSLQLAVVRHIWRK
jgi:hypothetical protein